MSGLAGMGKWMPLFVLLIGACGVKKPPTPILEAVAPRMGPTQTPTPLPTPTRSFFP